MGIKNGKWLTVLMLKKKKEEDIKCPFRRSTNPKSTQKDACLPLEKFYMKTANLPEGSSTILLFLSSSSILFLCFRRSWICAAQRWAVKAMFSNYTIQHGSHQLQVGS